MKGFHPTQCLTIDARKGTFFVATNVPNKGSDFVWYEFTFYRARAGKQAEVYGYLPFGRFYACGNSMDAAQRKAFTLVDEYLNLASVAEDFPAFALVHAARDENGFWQMAYAYADVPVNIDYDADKREWFAEMNGIRAYALERAAAVRALLEKSSRETLEPGVPQ